MNNFNNQQIILQEERSKIPFLFRNFNLIGIKIPYWLCIIIVIIILLILIIPETIKYKEVIPNYAFNVSSDTPNNTAIDKILNN